MSKPAPLHGPVTPPSAAASRPTWASAAPLASPAPHGFVAVDQLLRDRDAFVQRVAHDRELRQLVRALVVAIAVGAAVIGGSLGLYRGGMQVPFAAIKLPLATLLTVCLTVPLLSALRQAREGRGAPRQDFALVLGACALGVLVAGGCLPLYLLGYAMGLPGRAMQVGAVLCCGVGGLAGLVLLWRGLAVLTGRRHRLVGAVFVLAISVVGAQMCWTLRPWLQQRAHEPTVWVRSVSGSFLNALDGSDARAVGVRGRR